MAITQKFMTPETLQDTLTELFGSSVQLLAPGSWQVETSSFRLLVLLSEDGSWLRMLVPITTEQNAQPFLKELLQANFDTTQEVRYALHQQVLWGVYQHSRESLTQIDFAGAIARLVDLQQNQLSDCFEQLVNTQVSTIIRAAKQQGQSLESTLQSLNRFYEEGLLGDMSQTVGDREQILAAWRRRLESLWNEVET